MLHPEGYSIWGDINTCVVVAKGIFYVFAEHGEGIMVPKENAEYVLSSKAISIGTEDNGFLCYGRGDNADIPFYEILQKRIAQCRRIEARTLDEMKEIRDDGHLCLTDYFGECPPPENKETNERKKIRNGVYFVGKGNKCCLTVHREVAENFLSPIACEFGTYNNDYIYYDLITSAIPLYELSQVFNEVQDIIVSKDSLYATITQNFKTYLSLYNAAVPEEDQIPTAKSSIGMFLGRQLRQKKEKPTSPFDRPKDET